MNADPNFQSATTVRDPLLAILSPRTALSHVPDQHAPRTPRQAGAWCVPDSVETDYDARFIRYFHKPKTMRTLEKIRADILTLEKETAGLLDEIIGRAQG